MLNPHITIFVNNTLLTCLSVIICVFNFSRLITLCTLYLSVINSRVLRDAHGERSAGADRGDPG